MPSRLSFGLNDVVPEGVGAVWGARLIFPDDVLWDRQDILSDTDEARTLLIEWLNAGALLHARQQARALADGHELRSDEDRMVTLVDDGVGTIVANPRASFGYLYVAAWLKG